MNAFQALALIICAFSGAFLAVEFALHLCARILSTFDRRPTAPFSDRFRD